MQTSALAPMLAVAIAAVSAAADHTFLIREYLGQTWRNELVTYRIPAGEVPEKPALFDSDGKPVPVQVRPQQDGRVEVSFVVDALFPGGKASYALRSGTGAEAGSLCSRESAALVLDAGNVAARVPLPGEQTFDPPAPMGRAPAPLLAVRGRSGTWLGRGYLDGDVTVTAVRTTLLADGPVYAEVRSEYALAGGRYAVNVRVVRGQDVVLVTDEFDTPKAARSEAFFRFSLTEGLEPERVAVKGRLWRKRTDKKDTPAGSDYALDFDEARRELSVIGYVPWWPETARVITLYGTDGADTLTFLPSRIGQWRNPVGTYLETQPDRGVRLSFPLFVDQEWTRDGIDRKSPYYTGRLEPGWTETACRRRWTLFLSTHDQALAAEGRSAVARAVIRHSDLPLDKIKDWVFEWDSGGVTYPRLYVHPENLQAIRQRALAEPGWDTQLGRYWLRPVTHILRPDATTAEEVLRFSDGRGGSWHQNWGALPGMQHFVQNLFENWGYVGYPSPNQAGPMLQLVRFDAAMSARQATPAERDRMRVLAAFVAQIVHDQDWHATRAGWHLGNPNMPPRQEHHLGVASRALPRHPLAPEWRKRGEAELTRLVDSMTRSSGTWRECPHYQWEAAMYPMFQSAVPIKLAGATDLFANPKLTRTWDYLAGLLTPPSPRFRCGGRRLRVLPAFGNGSWEFVPLFGWLGAMTADTDPAFSARMMWAWNVQGRPFYSLMSRLVIDPSLPAEEPRLASTLYRGFGCTLRSGFPSQNETWLAFRHGDCIEHYNYGDQGSFMLYAKGSPLVLHFGSQYTPYFQGAWYFNRACVNHRPVNTQDPIAAQLGDVPGNYALGTELWCEDGSNDYVMRNKAFLTFDAADYARAEQIQQWQGVVGKDPTIKLPPNTPVPRVDIPDHTWTREILFLKDPDPAAPNYYVMRDDFASDAPLPGEWNVWALADTVETTASTATVRGKYGVDMDVYMAGSEQPSWSTRQETNKFLPQASRNVFSGGEWEEVLTNLRATRQAGRGFLAVLYPRSRTETPATFETIADGNGVKATTPRGTDWVLMSPEPTTWVGDGMRLTGKAITVRLVGGRWDVAFFAAGAVTVGGREIVADSPMQAAVAVP